MKNDIENVLNEKARSDIEARVRKLTIEQKYMASKLPDDARITGIERNLTLSLNELNINNSIIDDATLIKVSEAEKEYYQILSYSETAIENSEVERVSAMLKLPEQDIYEILETGLTLKKIEELGIEIIKDSAQNQKAMSTKELKESIIDENVDTKQNQVINVTKVKEKTIISKIDEVGEVDEKGKLELSEDMQKQLRPYELSGIKELKEPKYLVKEKEPTKDAELGEEIYKIVPEKTLQRKQEKQEEEKEQIAEELDEDSNDIVGIIRVKDRETCSQILNDDSIKTSAEDAVIVRFKNNRFKAMKESTSGKKSEIVGFKATPAFENIAPALENKVGNLYSTFYAGDITAGKRVDGQKYDIFYVDTGDRGNGIGNLIVVDSDGKNTMDMIRPAKCGGYEIEFADSERVYPSTVIMEANDGDKLKHVHENEDEHKEIHDEEKNNEDVLYKVADDYSGSLAEEKELLEELLKIDDKIAELQNSPNIEIGTTLRSMSVGAMARIFFRKRCRSCCAVQQKA